MSSQTTLADELDVKVFATGWNAAVRRAVRVKVSDCSLNCKPPRAKSVDFSAGEIKTSGVMFHQSPVLETLPLASRTPTKQAARLSGDANSPDKRTRIKPPKDTVKLEDRLFYLLQPPLETWLNTESLTFPFPPFDYQYEGVAFLFPRYSAVLADEMGLGKTMQAITTIRLLLRSGEIPNVLLVCPKPLVTNWQREFNQWAPEIPTVVIEGNQTRRHWQWENEIAPVRIVNYEVVIRDQELVTQTERPFGLVVLDEAQRIKNRLSSTSQIIRNIPRTRGWALTGTPVENSPDDLVGIFEFLSPGFLSTNMTPRHMGQVAGDHILRRQKSDVLTDLPPKLYRDADLRLTKQQQRSYEMAESDGVIKLEEMGSDITIQHVFELVLRLKQICNFDPATSASSKCERLKADLEEVAASGRKAIVFSQWVNTIEKLTGELGQYNPLEYHGKIPSKRRDGILDEFKNDPNRHVLLMSYGAGSVGLNLQFCEYVFLFDRWWNPAVEDQAINRAHRIGAAGPVTVTRFLSVGTIEERINAVLDKKRELFDTILSQADGVKRGGLTQNEIFSLFNLSKTSSKNEAAA